MKLLIKNKESGIKQGPDGFSMFWPPEKPVKKRFVYRLNRVIWIPKNPYRVVSLGPFFIRKTLFACAGYLVIFTLAYIVFWLAWALITMEGL
jgi:hypothetical protein